GGRSASSRTPTGWTSEPGVVAPRPSPLIGDLASPVSAGSGDRLVDDRAEPVDDREVAGDVGLGAVAAPPDAGVEGLGGAADHGVGLDARVGDDVEVVLPVLDPVGV